MILEISDKRVTEIPIIECNESLVDINDYSSLRYGEPPESLDTAPNYRLLRESLIAKLERAQLSLPKGLSFRLYEGYRSPEFQEKLFQEQLARTMSLNSQWDRARCYNESAKLVSPLQTFNGVSITPPHSTGGAIDIEIVNLKGLVINFGMEIKDWFKVEPQCCESSYPNLPNEAKESREMLISILEFEGFANYPREWWHFSYGDQYWAASNNEPNAIYDRIDN